MNKHKRYRLKCVSEGRCPHCGKPCAPYYECEDRRIERKVNRTLNRLAGLGIITKQTSPGRKCLYKFKQDISFTGREGGYKTRSGDPRLWPRIGKQYIDLDALAVRALRGAGGPLHENELLERIRIAVLEMKETANR